MRSVFLKKNYKFSWNIHSFYLFFFFKFWHFLSNIGRLWLLQSAFSLREISFKHWQFYRLRPLFRTSAFNLHWVGEQTSLPRTSNSLSPLSAFRRIRSVEKLCVEDRWACYKLIYASFYAVRSASINIIFDQVLT